MSYAFLSYSHDDDEYVAKLRTKLGELGFATWQDTDLKIGSSWEDEIIKAIRDCGALIVIVSDSSRNSQYVKNEILWAKNYDKRIFPVLLFGDPMLNIIDLQHEILHSSRDYLPSIKFFDNLQEFVSRTPQEHTPSKPAPIKPQPVQQQQDNIDETIPNRLRVDLQYWTDHIRQGSTNFYGLAMLALSYEKIGQHSRAMFFMRKAMKIEPRVIHFEWMKDNYNWTEEHNELLEKLKSDNNFWSSSIS